MYRKLLSPGRCRPRKHRRLILPELSFQQFEHSFIIKIRIVIMHLNRIRTIMIHNILHRNPFAKICFKTIYSTVYKPFQLTLIPFCRIRVCKINFSHSGLPQICLPYASVCRTDQISFFRRLIKQCGILRNIRIDPYTQFQSPFMIPF